MNFQAILAFSLLAQLSVAGTLRIIGRVDADASKYLRVAPPGGLSPDISIRVLGPKEESYSPCFPAVHGLCEEPEMRITGPVKILIESEGYEPTALTIPVVVFRDNTVTPVNIGTVRLKEAMRPRLVRVATDLSTPGSCRFMLTIRNPAKQPFSIEAISLRAKKDRTRHGPCDSKRYETSRFTQQVRLTGGAGEWTKAATDGEPAEAPGSLSQNCGDEYFNLSIASPVAFADDLLATLQIDLPDVIQVSPANVHPGTFNSYNFRLTSVRKDSAKGNDVTEFLDHELIVPSRHPVIRTTPPRRPGVH